MIDTPYGLALFDHRRLVHCELFLESRSDGRD